ncbi:lysine decarboxylase-like protein-like protein [Hortaea werneckii]|nr:lysine decarboxylase-like protein-like protein [Hortaea werneckii]
MYFGQRAGRFSIRSTRVASILTQQQRHVGPCIVTSPSRFPAPASRAVITSSLKQTSLAPFHTSCTFSRSYHPATTIMASTNGISTMNEPKQSENTAPTANGREPKPTVCVFCGSQPGTSPAHLAAARALAHALHANNISLVYGGGTVGIMGEVAKTLVSLSGPEAVHGVIPEALIRYERNYNEDGSANAVVDPQKVIDEKTYGRTTVVKDMHTRKQMMAREVIEGGVGGGFIALSGGYGTLEELMEVVTWNQLGIHGMPVVVYNVEGYWDGLMQWVRKAVSAGFVGEGNKGIMVEAREAEDVVAALKSYQNAEGRFKLDWEAK